jgi:hypothetical protein
MLRIKQSPLALLIIHSSGTLLRFDIQMRNLRMFGNYTLTWLRVPFFVTNNVRKPRLESCRMAFTLRRIRPRKFKSSAESSGNCMAVSCDLMSNG